MPQSLKGCLLQLGEEGALSIRPPQKNTPKKTTAVGRWLVAKGFWVPSLSHPGGRDYGGPLSSKVRKELRGESLKWKLQENSLHFLHELSKFFFSLSSICANYLAPWVLIFRTFSFSGLLGEKSAIPCIPWAISLVFFFFFLLLLFLFTKNV